MTEPVGDTPGEGHGVAQVRGSSLLLTGQAFAICVNFITQILIIRYLPVADFGALAYILSLTWVARNLSTLGLHRVLPSLVPQYHEREDYRRLFGAIVLQAGAILVLGLGLWMVLLAATAVGHPVFADEPGRSLVIILTLLIPLEALDYFLFEMLMAAFNRPKAIFFRKHIIGPLVKVAIVASLVGIGASVQWLALGMVLATVIGIGVYLPLVVRVFADMGLTRHLAEGISIPWNALSMAIPMLTTEIMLAARYSLDAVTVQANDGFHAVAQLRAIQPAANVNDLVAASFALLFLPLASRLIERGGGAELNAVYWRTAAWQIALSMPVFLLTFSLAPTTTVILAGQQYESSAILLATLATGSFVATALGPAQLVLVAAGRIRYIVTGNVVVAVVSIALLLLLVPPLGPLGAALATAIAVVLQRGYELLGLGRTAVSRVSTANLGLTLTVAAAALTLLAIQEFLNPPLIVAFAIAGAMVLLTFRLFSGVLAVDQTFPEVLRIPGARLVLGHPAVATIAAEEASSESMRIPR